MPRGKRRQTEQNSVHNRILQAEKKIATGIREAVYVSEDKLETVLKLIERHGMTKAQILRKAVRLGLEVLSQELCLSEVSEVLEEINNRACGPGKIIEVDDPRANVWGTLDAIGIPREALSGSYYPLKTEGVTVATITESPFVAAVTG